MFDADLWWPQDDASRLARLLAHRPDGESFDSHRLEKSLIHVPHLRAANEIRRAEPLH
jgi:hypothetical protein